MSLGNWRRPLESMQSPTVRNATTTTNFLRNNSSILGGALTNTTMNPPKYIVDEPPIVFWCFLAIEALLIVLGNGMLCWLFISRRKLRTQQNYFVLSLSISDFLVGLTIAPCEYCVLGVNSELCSLFCGTVLSFNMLASTINLVLIAADRYYSIMCPFRYQEVVSKTRAKVIIVIGWLTTLVLTLLPLSWAVNDSIHWKKKAEINLRYVVTLFVLVLVIGVLLGMSYYQIVRMVQSKLKEVKEKATNPAGIKVCILVAISFFICWIPTCITELLIASANRVPVKAVMNTVYFIFLLNPCLDPIMYAYYRRDFRQELAEWRKRRWRGMKKLYDRIFQKTYQHHRKVQRWSAPSDSNTLNNNDRLDSISLQRMGNTIVKDEDYETMAAPLRLYAYSIHNSTLESIQVSSVQDTNLMNEG